MFIFKNDNVYLHYKNDNEDYVYGAKLKFHQGRKRRTVIMGFWK